MRIYTLDEIINTEHIGDERYVRYEEIERLKKRIDNKVEIQILEANRDHAEIERLREAIKDIYAYAQSAPEDEMDTLNNAIDNIIKITDPILRAW